LPKPEKKNIRHEEWENTTYLKERTKKLKQICSKKGDTAEKLRANSNGCEGVQPLAKNFGGRNVGGRLRKEVQKLRGRGKSSRPES